MTMTLKAAILILIKHAARDCAGTGRGIRSVPTRAEGLKLAESIRRVWPRCYGYEISTRELEETFGICEGRKP